MCFCQVEYQVHLQNFGIFNASCFSIRINRPTSQAIGLSRTYPTESFNLSAKTVVWKSY